jgi:hypothetical protein
LVSEGALLASDPSEVAVAASPMFDRRVLSFDSLEASIRNASLDKSAPPMDIPSPR